VSGGHGRLRGRFVLLSLEALVVGPFCTISRIEDSCERSKWIEGKATDRSTSESDESEVVCLQNRVSTSTCTCLLTLMSLAQSPNAALSNLKSLLSQTLRVSIHDGRTFVGTFAGTDQLLNILLVNTEEYRSNSMMGRYVGQVMIPWKFVVTAEVNGRLVSALAKDKSGGELQAEENSLYT
jgi:small nuclear ribonucleoprotein (snRNP)-like protein